MKRWCGSIDAALVDLDGTLVDTMGDFVACIHAMLDELGLPRVAAEVVERGVGKGSENLLDLVLNTALAQVNPAATAMDLIALKEPLKAPAWQHYQRHYRAINGQNASVYPGAFVGLQQMQSGGLQLACVTNKPLEFAVQLLKATALDGFFSCVVGGDSYAEKKPHPMPLLKACEALGSLPSRSLMLGDSSNDAQAARSAGCPVVLVTYGYNHGLPIESAKADGYLQRLDDLRWAD